MYLAGFYQQLSRRSRCLLCMKCEWQNKGFTLFELVVVLAIIAAMVTVIMPYANKSNDSQKLREQALNIVETIKYAIGLAADTGRSIRFTIDVKSKGYSLETEGESGIYEPTAGPVGAVRYMGKTIYITDLEGFYPTGKRWYLTFDSSKKWPKATLTISTKDLMEKIIIQGRRVQIEETSI